MSNKRKRVSADEKKTRTLAFFHEKKEFYTLKELESNLPQQIGITAQSVKDVIQDLADNGLINSEKVGTSVYFWSIPGEKIPYLESKNAEEGKRILNLESKLSQIKSQIQSFQSSQENPEEKEKLLNEIQVLKAKQVEAKKQLAKYSDIDPEVIKETEKKANHYKDAANLWTDNIYAIQTWCKNKFGIEESQLNKQFNIPEDLDYVT